MTNAPPKDLQDLLAAEPDLVDRIFDYLLSTRIQNSLPLLMKGENITTIAGLVGFSSPAYYGQIFKRYMGMSPSQYKKNAAQSPSGD